MKRILRGVMAALIVVAGLASAGADDVALDGHFIQGGLVVGKTEPGAEVTLDGTAVPVSGEGTFLLGFAPDAKPEAELVVRAGGRETRRTLKIAQREYETQEITGLPPRMVTPTPDDLVRIRAERERIDAAKRRRTEAEFFHAGFVWPAEGPITGVYGSRRILNGEPRTPHWGVDVGVPEGTPVRAASPGVVVLADPDLYFTGGTVILDHGLGLTSVYSHLSRVLVREGESVDQTTVIGLVGATGRATGAHLDWRVNLFTTPLDPALIAGPMPRGDEGMATGG